MSVRWAAVLSALWLLGAAACSESDMPGRVEESRGGCLQVLIRWSGDDFATSEDLAFRDRLQRRLAEEGAGRIVRSGTGMGWMDIVLEAQNSHSALVRIEKLASELQPDIPRGRISISFDAVCR